MALNRGLLIDVEWVFSETLVMSASWLGERPQRHVGRGLDAMRLDRAHRRVMASRTGSTLRVPTHGLPNALQLIASQKADCPNDEALLRAHGSKRVHMLAAMADGSDPIRSDNVARAHR